MKVSIEASNTAPKVSFLMRRLTLVTEKERGQATTPFVHQEGLEDVSGDAGSSVKEITKRQVQGEFSIKPKDPFKTVHFTKAQLSSSAWYDYTPKPRSIRASDKLPPDCTEFQSIMSLWMQDSDYPKFRERQMFHRYGAFIMVARWENWGELIMVAGFENLKEIKRPLTLDAACDLPVVHDRSSKWGETSPTVKFWITRRLQKCYAEQLSGLLLHPQLRLVLSYDIAYSEIKQIDLERGNLSPPQTEPSKLLEEWVAQRQKIANSENIEKDKKKQGEPESPKRSSGITLAINADRKARAEAARESQPKLSNP